MSVDFTYHPAVVSGVSDHQGLWIYFHDGQVLMPSNSEGSQEPPWTYESYAEHVDKSMLLGKINGVDCQAAQLKDIPENWMALGLRDYLMTSPEEEFKVINAAYQLLFWLNTQNYCSRCGTKLEFNDNDRCLTCPACGYRSYPKISPCVIVLIKRGREILLAQSHRFKQKMYSCLAGFIECGESAEEAVQREVAEEVSLKVKDITYYASQAWPFPHQLMLGYIANYDSGELKIDTEELFDAAWFDIDNLPNIPPHQTIARHLIESAIEQIRQDH